MQAPAADIFISYRRSDAAAAQALYGHLNQLLGPGRVAMDLAVLSPGDDFRQALHSLLQNCRVVLVLVSHHWTAAVDANGQRRLDNEQDFVRLEVATALSLNKRVIPLLLDGAPLPRAAELPPDLQPLAHRDAMALVFSRFDADAERLVELLRRLLAIPETDAPALEALVSAEAAAPAPVPNTAPAPPTTPRPHPPPADDAPAESPPPPATTPWALTTALLRQRLQRVLRPGIQPQAGADPASRTGKALLLALAGLVLAAGALLPYAGMPAWPGMRAAAGPAAPAPGTAATTPLPVPPAGTRFRDCPDDTCPWLVVVPAGSFVMGSPENEEGRAKERDKDESPQHRVTIAQPFAVMETEVTLGLYRRFAQEMQRPPGEACNAFKEDKSGWDFIKGTDWRNPFKTRGFQQGDEHPVVCVDWNDALALARWMTQRTGQPYRLLSEAEWEYVARAGSSTRFSFGAQEGGLCSYGNVADASARRGLGDVASAEKWVYAACNDGHVYTAPVASYLPNAWGVYDMHGNAWEWVHDCYADYTAAERDASPREQQNCERRLLRGGAWSSSPASARAASRDHGEPAVRSNNFGLRLARMLPPGS